MERGEVWWALLDERRPVVLLSGGESQIVAPASTEEKRGFVVLSGEQASDFWAMGQIVASTSAATRAVGLELEIGSREGLPYDGVVRVAFPRDGQIFCTWLVTLTQEYLIDRAGVLSSAKLRQLENALRLAEIE